MKILFFTPFSGVLPHVRPEVLLAEGLKKNGHDVTFVNCDGIYSDFCICMSAHGLNEFSTAKSKMDYCISCKNMRDWNNKHFQFNNYYIDTYLTPSEILIIENLHTQENGHILNTLV